MTEDDGRLVASSTLDVHEVGVGGGEETLEFVALSFSFEGWVKQISVHVLI